MNQSTNTVYSTETIDKMVAELMDDEWLDQLSNWENIFINDMSIRISHDEYISEKQRNKIAEIYGNYVI